MKTSAKAAGAGWKDWAGGALLSASAVAVIATARGYGIGTLTDMGAGYFPALVGAVLLGIGLLMLAQSAWRQWRPEYREAPMMPNVHAADAVHVPFKARLRGGVCIIAGIVAFIVLGKYGGLLPASFAVVFIPALGDRDNTLKSAFLVALAMTALCVVVFWWALQLQMPLFQFAG